MTNLELQIKQDILNTPLAKFTKDFFKMKPNYFFSHGNYTASFQFNVFSTPVPKNKSLMENICRYHDVCFRLIIEAKEDKISAYVLFGWVNNYVDDDMADEFSLSKDWTDQELKGKLIAFDTPQNELNTALEKTKVILEQLKAFLEKNKADITLVREPLALYEETHGKEAFLKNALEVAKDCFPIHQ